MQAQQDTLHARIALSPLELPETAPDSARAFEDRLVAALAVGKDSASVVRPDLVRRQLEETDHVDAWSRVLFTFVTTGIVDPVDLATVCDGLHVGRILHLEVAEVVERGPVHAHGQMLLGARVALRAWLFDCRTMQLAWERWAEGKHDIPLSGAVDTTWSLLTVGAAGKAIDALSHSLRP